MALTTQADIGIYTQITRVKYDERFHCTVFCSMNILIDYCKNKLEPEYI